MKLKFIAFLVLFFASLYFGYKVSEVRAVDAIPDPVVPCQENEAEDPEFSSLRPYQASPCGPAPRALFCNNNYVIREEVKDDKEAEVNAAGKVIKLSNCSRSGGKWICPTNRTINKNYSISLHNATLPILGNTQGNENSESGDSGMDNSQKMNEYVNWYLQGTLGRAEHEDSYDDIVNYSGPAKKVLPQAIQDLQRLHTLRYAGVQTPYTDNIGFNTKDTDANQSGIQVEESYNHNQIVLCTTNNLDINLFGQTLITIPWIGQTKPTPCYDGNGKRTNGDALRLLDWWDRKQAGYGPALTLIPGWNGIQVWTYATPPYPWNFKKDVYYQKAYQEWRGKVCLFIPVIDKLIGCADDTIPGTGINLLFRTNKYADFYQYIPLGNTADKTGDHGAETVVVHTATNDTQAEILGYDYPFESVPILFYPHYENVADTAEALNSAHTPLDCKKNDCKPFKGIGNGIEPETCDIVDVRSNEGDPITFDSGKITHIAVNNVRIHVSQISCTEESIQSQVDNENYFPTCKGEILVTIPTYPRIPFSDDVWEQTVAGKQAVLRQIFPKIQDGAPINCIADIPASTKVDYSPTTDTNLVRTEGPGGKVFGGTSGELYFPHLGSIYEYFLKGIQTALRPQGYGEPITSGEFCSSNACGDLPRFPRSEGQCRLNSVSSDIGQIPISLKQIVEGAAEAFHTPPNLILAILYGEGVFNKGKFAWTDNNVKNWASCQKIPGCNETGEDNFAGWNGNTFKIIAGRDEYKKVMQALDPGRTKYSQCNLLDTIYALSYNLRQTSAGGGGMPNKCYGITLGGKGWSSSCDWNDQQYGAAIQAAENGYDPGCMTKSNSCAEGGGKNAICPGNADTCEKIDAKYKLRSHFRCLWEVAHGQ